MTAYKKRNNPSMQLPVPQPVVPENNEEGGDDDDDDVEDDDDE